jgi:ribosomal protein S18 acetylase RimI-like enzyme
MLVHPDYQGRGIGKRILQRGLEESDKAGRAVFLESTLAGTRLYESCGFEVVETLNVQLPNGTQHPMGLMIRQPKS